MVRWSGYLLFSWNVAKFADVAVTDVSWLRQNNHCMEKISAVIIALNEESRIAATIGSLEGVADEIIVVDSFSTDRTVEIARGLGCRVEQRHFSGFGAQRQYATSLTTYRYVLFIDADEVLSPGLRKILIEMKTRPFAHRVYSMSRLNFFCDNPIRHCGWYPDRQVRLFDKRYASWNFHDIGERVIFPDTLHPEALDGDILHYRCSDVKEYGTKLDHQAEIYGRVIAARLRKVGSFVPQWNAFKAFFRCYISDGGILEGRPGRQISAQHFRSTLKSYKIARSLIKNK